MHHWQQRRILAAVSAKQLENIPLIVRYYFDVKKVDGSDILCPGLNTPIQAAIQVVFDVRDFN
jgi:hypothetical protein